MMETGINNLTHEMSLLVEVGGERVAVRAGRLHAGMHLRDRLLLEPVGELREALRVVGEDLVAELATLTHEAGVEFELGYVESER